MTTKQSDNTNIKPKRIEKNAKPMVIAGLSRNYLFGEPMDPSNQWQELGRHLGNIPGQIENVAYGVCFDLAHSKGFEYLCGVEVSDGHDLPENFVWKQLPAFTYAVFDHEGHTSGIRQTCDAIWKEWIPESGVEKPEEANFFFERYGEEFDPQTGTGDIEIWIPALKISKSRK